MALRFSQTCTLFGGCRIASHKLNSLAPREKGKPGSPAWTWINPSATKQPSNAARLANLPEPQVEHVTRIMAHILIELTGSESPVSRDASS